VASLYYDRFDLLPRGKEEKEGWLTGDQEDEIRGCVVRMEEAMIFGVIDRTFRHNLDRCEDSV
jgi:hypothetical protein